MLLSKGAHLGATKITHHSSIFYSLLTSASPSSTRPPSSLPVSRSTRGPTTLGRERTRAARDQGTPELASPAAPSSPVPSRPASGSTECWDTLTRSPRALIVAPCSAVFRLLSPWLHCECFSIFFIWRKHSGNEKGFKRNVQTKKRRKRLDDDDHAVVLFLFLFICNAWFRWFGCSVRWRRLS